jgi:hypothetical protein
VSVSQGSAFLQDSLNDLFVEPVVDSASIHKVVITYELVITLTMSVEIEVGVRRRYSANWVTLGE